MLGPITIIIQFSDTSNAMPLASHLIYGDLFGIIVGKSAPETETVFS
jgi:hypothetical protein